MKQKPQTAPPSAAPARRPWPPQPAANPRNGAAADAPDPVELASILSFPASDPPAWIARRPKKS